MKWCNNCQAETERNAHGRCRICARAASARYHSKRAKERNAYNKEWRQQNAERVSAQKKARYDRERNNEQMRAYRRKNPEKIKVIQQRSYRNNPGLYISHAIKRAARMVKQTPAWANQDAINAIYRQCREFRDAGIDCEVDHIYPLKGKLVSGLHCEANLQIISTFENRSKSNRSPPP